MLPIINFSWFSIFILLLLFFAVELKLWTIYEWEKLSFSSLFRLFVTLRKKLSFFMEYTSHDTTKYKNATNLNKFLIKSFISYSSRAHIKYVIIWILHLFSRVFLLKEFFSLFFRQKINYSILLWFCLRNQIWIIISYIIYCVERNFLGNFFIWFGFWKLKQFSLRDHAWEENWEESLLFSFVHSDFSK